MFSTALLTISWHWFGLMVWCRAGDNPIPEPTMALLIDAYMLHPLSNPINFVFAQWWVAGQCCWHAWGIIVFYVKSCSTFGIGNIKSPTSMTSRRIRLYCPKKQRYHRIPDILIFLPQTLFPWRLLRDVYYPWCDVTKSEAIVLVSWRLFGCHHVELSPVLSTHFSGGLLLNFYNENMRYQCLVH